MRTRAEQRFLPIANVGRIMKKCLPSTTKVSKDAKECVQECTSEFISFITSEAAERCELEKRKTINGEVSTTQTRDLTADRTIGELTMVGAGTGYSVCDDDARV